MSERDRRPQAIPERGLRVVLLAPRKMTDPTLLSATAEIDRVGWILVAVIAPEKFVDALRMVLVGLVDRIVVTQISDLPNIVLAADLGLYGTAPAGGRWREERTRILPRGGAEATTALLRQRRPGPVERPQPVEGPAEGGEEERAEFRHRAADLASARPDSSTEIAQARAEFGTQVPTGRRRASDRHGRTVAQSRKRRTA